MMPDDYAGLIARLKAATGPDRELDGRIWCAIEGVEFVMWDGAGVVYRESEGAGIRHLRHSRLLEYSRSIDVAVTTVPEGWWVSRINQYHDHRTGPLDWWGAHLRRLPTPTGDTCEVVGERRGSLPIAILIASLCARAHQQE